STTGQLIPPVAITVSVKNESPPSTANSNINSFQFTVSGLALLNGSGDIACPNARCSVDPSTGTVYVTNISPPVQAQQVMKVTFHASSCVAKSEAFISSNTVYSGSQLNGDTFVAFGGKPDTDFPMVLTLSTRDAASPPTIADTGISCGPINCGQDFPVADSRTSCGINASNPICVTTRRGNDKNGAVCTSSPVDYFVTNLLEPNGKMHFKWETNSAGAFAYRVNVPFPSTPITDPPTTPVPPPWQVSWLPTDGNAIFIGAATCVGADVSTFPASPDGLPLPAQLTTLASAVKVNDKQIKVVSTPLGLPTGVFSIVIDGERMDVTKVNSNTWTVTRGTGLTQATTHAVNKPVMSTPLPTLTSGQFSTDQNVLAVQQTVYSVGQQAQICRASASQDNGDDTWSAWFIDIGDGWVLGR
ncbi:MAG TPA: hypothetical protein VFO53_15140, partial [Casimicrobiaceae bacterium]|nr:hypothetical protein [Casimicrobiaceae bacterium]